MGRLGIGDGARGDGVVVVLARDLDHARLEPLHGVVGAVVPEGQLVGRTAQRSGQDLVAEADAEHRYPADQVGHGGRGAGQRSRIARPVGEEDAVGLEREHLGGRRARRHHRDRAERRQEVDHGGLHAEVVGHDAQAAGSGGGVDTGLGGGHARHQVHAVGADGGRRGGAELGLGRRAERAGHRTRVADVTGQAPRVDPGHGRHAVTVEEGLETLGRAPVRRFPSQVAHHHSPAVGRDGLVVGRVGAVVADVGAREGDHLARVGRVGDDLLVPAHGRVEDELAGGHGDRRPRRLPGEHGAVRRHQERRRPVPVDARDAHRCATASITTASPRSTVWRTAPANERPA